MVNLQFLYYKIRQILQNNLVVTLEKIVAVESYIVKSFAIDIDISIRFHLSPGQLAHKSIEHCSFGDIECLCIVNNGISPICHLKARCPDNNLVESYRAHTICCIGKSFQFHGRKAISGCRLGKVEIMPLHRRIIAGIFNTHHIFTQRLWNIECVERIALIDLARCRIYCHRIFVEQSNECRQSDICK